MRIFHHQKNNAKLRIEYLFNFNFNEVSNILKTLVSLHLIIHEFIYYTNSKVSKIYRTK